MSDFSSWSRDELVRYVRAGETAEERFSRIFETRYWRGGGKETVSGYGSTIEYTADVRARLLDVIETFRIGSMFDAPCGDFNWMRLVVAASGIDYRGGDIVRPLIAQNQKTHGRANVRFIHADITTSTFPTADLWFCRDCLFHLSLADGLAALGQFVASDIPYILTSTHKNDDGFRNTDITSGSFRRIDLFAPPFSLPRDVLFRFDDFMDEWPREMCLWTRAQVATALGQSAG